MYEALIVSFAVQKSILLRCDHSTGDVHCHPYTISRSSQIGGLFGCGVIIIPIEGNDSSTGGSQSHRWNFLAMALDGVLYTIPHPWIRKQPYKDILDISARFPLLFFHGLPEGIDKYPFVLAATGGRMI